MSTHDPDPMPDIWGAGQLLAFSGLDGPTPPQASLVLLTREPPLHFELKLPASARIDFEGMPQASWRLLLGDAWVADSAAGPFRAAFLDAQTLVGEAPESVELRLEDRRVGPQPRRCSLGAGAALDAIRAGRRWAVRLQSAVPADWAALLNRDLGALVAERARFVRELPLPAGLEPGQIRFLRKLASVMKVNTCSATSAIPRLWSTPDRWPHRNMWLWDSAFHAVGMACFIPEAAQDFLTAMLEHVEPGGRLPHMVEPAGGHSEVTQPPVLAWAVRTVFERTRSADWAAECLPRLQAYLDWDRNNRDRNGNGVPEWNISGAPLCRCGESGADNSSAYDRAVLLDAPDFAGYLCHDYQCLADLARRLGRDSLAEECRTRAREIREATNAVLWSPEAQFYLHRDFDGAFVRVKTVAGFMPLAAGIPGPEQANALRRRLVDPAAFGAPFPVPSEALDSGTFCKDMWRGPTWVNMNFLLFLGLRRYGFRDEAAMIREKTLAEIRRWYEETGCIWEYYDSLGVTPPGELDRKQRLISGNGIAPISDYHFTAALAAAFLTRESNP